MGLIKESKDVDFYVIEKKWSIKELQEFSKLIEKKKQLHEIPTNSISKRELVN